jgi:hypothetical protein
MAWLSFSILGIVLAALAGFFFRWTNYPAILLCFVWGVVLSMLARYNTVRKLLDLYYPDKSAARHTVLIVDKIGVREVSGRTVSTYPWSDVNMAREIAGLAIISRRGEARMVPDYAFHAREDVKAFVATIVSLRNDRPAPNYDWSGYQDAPITDKGVWPPPIS